MISNREGGGAAEKKRILWLRQGTEGKKTRHKTATNPSEGGKRGTEQTTSTHQNIPPQLNKKPEALRGLLEAVIKREGGG